MTAKAEAQAPGMHGWHVDGVPKCPHCRDEVVGVKLDWEKKTVELIKGCLDCKGDRTRIARLFGGPGPDDPTKPPVKAAMEWYPPQYPGIPMPGAVHLVICDCCGNCFAKEYATARRPTRSELEAEKADAEAAKRKAAEEAARKAAEEEAAKRAKEDRLKKRAERDAKKKTGGDD